MRSIISLLFFLHLRKIWWKINSFVYVFSCYETGESLQSNGRARDFRNLPTSYYVASTILYVTWDKRPSPVPEQTNGSGGQTSQK